MIAIDTSAFARDLDGIDAVGSEPFEGVPLLDLHGGYWQRSGLMRAALLRDR